MNSDLNASVLKSAPLPNLSLDSDDGLRNAAWTENSFDTNPPSFDVRRGFSLKHKICVGLVGTLFLAALSSSLALVSAIHTENVLQDIVAENLEQARAVNELKIALLEERGMALLLVADGAPRWKEELEQKAKDFERGFTQVTQIRWESNQENLMKPLGKAFGEGQRKQDELLQLLPHGPSAEAKGVLFDELPHCYERVFMLCGLLEEANRHNFERAVSVRRDKIRQVGVWVGASLFLAAGLVFGLVYLLSHDLFRPLRSMTDEAHKYSMPKENGPARDEIGALGVYLKSLKAEVTEARNNLARSHTQLLDAEKLACVGKLAAGVAHEIRSPLTALRLRLFSMQKTLGDEVALRNDFQVMSQEITRLDNIVRNFLEFSRPPELQLRRCNVSLLIDKTLELLRYKLEAAQIRFQREESANGPSVLADAHQIQQVLINLLNNAVEAQPGGGSIHLNLAQESDCAGREMIVIRIADNGPGVPKDILHQIFSPFFTTKQQGAGLGLWIAHQIMTEHRGRLDLEKSSKLGAVFAVWIPLDQP